MMFLPIEAVWSKNIGTIILAINIQVMPSRTTKI